MTDFRKTVETGMHPRLEEHYILATHQSWVEEAFHSFIIRYGDKRRTEKTALEHGTSEGFHSLLKKMMAFLWTEKKENFVIEQ